MLVLRGEFGLAKKLRSTFDNSPALPESLPDFNGCPSVNHDKEEGLQCVSAYKINLEKKLTKEYAKEIVAKLTDGFVYEK